MKKGLFAGILSVGAIILTYFFTQWYVYLFPSYDYSTFLVGAVVPMTVTLSLPLALRNRVLLYASLAYFWALVDDGPVFLDSVFTWPEVTRFHPAAPHLFLEVLYHLLTAAFLVLAIREAAKGVMTSTPRTGGVLLLTTCAFVLAYAQNLPIGAIQTIVETQWFQLDIVEHVLSGSLLALAIYEARRGRAITRPRWVGAVLQTALDTRGQREG